MRITADTNVLVRAIVHDDIEQTRIAETALESAEVIAVPTPVLCELAWVLRQNYKLSNEKVALAVRTLIDTAKVSMDRAAAHAGLAALEAGTDFADGVIAFSGADLGSDTFVSFDSKAVKLLNGLGHQTQLLG